MKFRIALFLLLTTIFFRSALLLSEEQLEKQTQEQSNVLTVVATEKNLPFSFSLPDGTPSGLYVEFWRLWSETNNIPIRFVMVPFEEGLQLTRQKNTLHAGLMRNKQREQWADFSLPIHNVQTGLIYNRSINKKSKLRELNDIKISSYRSSFQEFYIRENYPDLKQSTYEDFDDAYKQLLNNDIQAVVTELPSAIAQLAKMGLTGVFTISEEVLVSNNVFALIAKDQPELLAKINAGIESISVNKIIELEKKWLPTLKPFFITASTVSSLTIVEKKWLSQNNSFSLGTDSKWAPFEFNDQQGQYSGISADYIHYAQQQLQINLKPASGYNWAEALEEFKLGNIDVMSAIANTEERAKYINFTNPYFEVPTAIVSKKNAFYAESLPSLSDRKLGLIKGYIFNELISRDYPNINIVDVVSIKDGLEKLQSGEIDAFADSIAAINYEISKDKINGLIVSSFLPYKLEISMAVRKGLEPLIPILNKTFAAMNEKQRSAIANNWLSIHMQTGIEISTIVIWVLPIGIFLMLIILIFVRMNRRLKIEIDGRIKSAKEQQMLVYQLHQSQKMEALGKLTGGIAHDFNNILGIMIGYSELLKNTLTEHPKSLKYASEIQYAGNRGAKLTSKLLAFSQKKKPEAHSVNLNTLLQSQRHMLEKTLTMRINLVFKLIENPWLVWLDEGDMEDAIFNMSINAMHAMGENGQLTIETHNKTVNVEDASSLSIVAGDYVLLSITDTGCGFDEETKEKIFNPFFTTKGKLGTGLGLSMVYSFVQSSNGIINIHSVEGEGAQFTFYFPRYHGAHSNEQLKTKGSSEDDLTGTESILVVDDEPALLDLVRETLTSHGFNVTCAGSAKDALSVLEHESIDILISDIIMPKVNGYQLAAIVKEKYPDIKIQLVSGFDGEHSAGIVDEELQHNLLQKPVSSLALLQRIRELRDEKP